MPDAIYIDFECLKTTPPRPMLLGILSDTGGRQQIEQLVVSDALKKLAGGRAGKHASIESAVRLVVDKAESNNCQIVGWSEFDRDVILEADISTPLKRFVKGRYVNALADARAWRSNVYPDVRIAREDRHSPKNTLDKFAALAGYRHVAALRAGTPAKWIRNVMKTGTLTDWRALLAYNEHDLQALRFIWLKAAAELATWRAYVRASYYVDVDRGAIRFKAGGINARLQALLLRTRTSRWAFMTAWNPGSTPRSREENDAAQARLTVSLAAMGYAALTGRGASDDGSWGPEESLMILGISRRKAAKLGRRFGQFAILTGRAGGRATLVSCAVPPKMP